jgi:predicted DsbA family dithiol-disulfide isomerase
MFANWMWWPNTLKAHQFVQYGVEHGVDSDRLNQILFHSLYEEGSNISIVEDLVTLASRHFDWNLHELRQYLEQDAGASKVRTDMESERRKYNVSSVPLFVISAEGRGRPYGVSGAQSSSTLKAIFVELTKEE